MNTLNKASVIKPIIFSISLVILLGFFSGCTEKDCDPNKVGCLDIGATNYDPNAAISSDSCCYNCYSEYTALGVFCGDEVEEMESTLHMEELHAWTLGGELCAPGTAGAVPAYDIDGVPIYLTFPMVINCD